MSEDFTEPAPVFRYGPKLQALREAICEFVDGTLVPAESRVVEHPTDTFVAPFRQKARSLGLFAPQNGLHLGGLGLNWRQTAVALEAAGRSLLGPLALHCAAPDEGNIHLLDRIVTASQRRKFLAPLAAGEMRSCFAMTEPDGAGADPSQLKTTARRHGGGWIVDGHKWFITGAEGAAFAIVLARTDHGATLFLVPAGGYRIVRSMPTIDRMTLGGHCEVRFDSCELGPEAVLGDVGRGFEYAQLRLAPARLTHCMRWLGVAVRSVEIAVRYARRRSSFGVPLHEHQAVGFKIADAHIQIHAARQMIAHAAWILDESPDGARHWSSMAKTFVSEAVGRVVDDMVQICGGCGVAEDEPIGTFYRETRPFRIYDGPNEVHRMSIARRVIYKGIRP